MGGLFIHKYNLLRITGVHRSILICLDFLLVRHYKYYAMPQQQFLFKSFKPAADAAAAAAAAAAAVAAAAAAAPAAADYKS